MSAHSAPTPPSTELQLRRMNSTPKWVNPCGMATDDVESGLDSDTIPDAQLLSLIVLQAKTALDHAKLFCNGFVKHIFNIDMKEVHTMWKNSHYSWLPDQKSIPKQLGEHLSKDYLEHLEPKKLDTILLDIYQYLQLYAVGLEQIVWDQDDYRLGAGKNFSDAEFKLRTRGEFFWFSTYFNSEYFNVTKAEEWNARMVKNCYRTWYAVLQVLCEVQVALMERGVQPRVDVTRAAMSNEYRLLGTSTTYRNVRDWLIFRDYMNGLEFVIEVFDYLRGKV
ncbi:hypothetical protein PV328_007602 [Microctonus aethiopoides]|nr:hypothetical protein PV328_007602 [Microctonus aethiopoides]